MKFRLEFEVDEKQLRSWNYQDQECISWLARELHAGALINYLQDCLERAGEVDISIKEIETKTKTDYSGYYCSIHSFIEENDLSGNAELLFGKDWEADQDIKQIQELLNSIDDGYVVKLIEGKTERDKRADDYIEVVKVDVS